MTEPRLNPYLDQAHRVLPRLLALFDADATSPMYGQGDRFHWAWKLIDFANGTFQGAAHGLARLLADGLLPSSFDEGRVLKRIDAMYTGARALTRRNGSLEEAFPYESSFCVTALVAYDLLTAIELLGDRLDATTQQRYVAVVEPMVRFLHRADETHGFISNHLATAAAALFKWTAVSGKSADDRGREILDRVLGAQSDEGWFREYDGADPGYQSLCTYYLADLHRLRPDLNLAEPLARSVRFLWHFAHPDGSFGGLYGSRNTRFFVPAGVEALAPHVPEAAALARFMRRAVACHRTVTLDVMDAPNLVPMFNTYCWAASLCRAGAGSVAKPDNDTLTLPAEAREPARLRWPKAGLIIDRGPRHYTVVSTHKGGVCCHFTRHEALDANAPDPFAGTRSHVNAGVVARSADDKRYSSQASWADNIATINGDTVTVTVTAPLTRMRHRTPTPGQFIVLRVLNVTLMRSRAMGEWVKRVLVRMLITGGGGGLAAKNKRTIHLGPDLRIEDEWVGPHAGLERVTLDGPFSAIHMAGQGYWQAQDDEAAP
jgi:hypothetical protein